jgi:hypothetical protein
MRPGTRCLLLCAVLAVFTGCSSVNNLCLPPTHTTGFFGAGVTSCEPFGGVRNSVVCAEFFLGYGYLVPVSVAILAVDTPLSLMADVLTWPIAQARQRKEPWATWWGDQDPESPPMQRPATAEPTQPANTQPVPVGN